MIVVYHALLMRTRKLCIYIQLHYENYTSSGVVFLKNSESVTITFCCAYNMMFVNITFSSVMYVAFSGRCSVCIQAKCLMCRY